MIDMLRESPPSWVSYHIYYHQDLNRVLLGFCGPMVASLLRLGWIDSFFFIRHGLGGPHIRLRFRTLPLCGDGVDRVVKQAASHFLALNPSRASLDEEVVRRRNQGILASDPNEVDDTVYPDNTILPISFRPEAKRYGGPALLAPSLDLFAASSIEAFHFLSRFGNEPRSRQLTSAFRLLFRQALHFALDEEELDVLLRYAVDGWNSPSESIARKARQVLASQREALVSVFENEILLAESSFLLRGVSADPSTPLAGATRCLSCIICGEDRRERWRIGGSQMHMTANRIGLTNIEEIYLSYLLSETKGYFMSARSYLIDDLYKVLRRSSDKSNEGEPSLKGILSVALAKLGEDAAMAGSSWSP
jgi:hypothetical protein